MYQLVSFCFLLAVSVAANAQSNAAVISAPAPENPSSEKNFSISAILSTSTNMEEEGSAQDSSGSSLEIKPSLRISRKAQLGGTLAAEYDAVTGNSNILNTQIVVARDPINLDNDNTLNITAQAILPTDKEEREKSSLRVAGGAIIGVTHKFAIMGKESGFTYAANMLKSSHEYERNADREANISHRLRHFVGLETQLNKKFSISIDGYYQIGWTYENVVKESFNSSQSLAYEINPNFSISLDHSFEGKMFAADGSESNADLYDSRQSEIGVSLMGTY